MPFIQGVKRDRGGDSEKTQPCGDNFFAAESSPQREQAQSHPGQTLDQRFLRIVPEKQMAIVVPLDAFLIIGVMGLKIDDEHIKSVHDAPDKVAQRRETDHNCNDHAEGECGVGPEPL